MAGESWSRWDGVVVPLFAVTSTSANDMWDNHTSRNDHFLGKLVDVRC